MADADRCVCCGTIIPEGSHVCPNCKAAVNQDAGMDAYAYLAKYMSEAKLKEDIKRDNRTAARDYEFCPYCGRKLRKRK